MSHRSTAARIRRLPLSSRLSCPARAFSDVSTAFSMKPKRPQTTRIGRRFNDSQTRFSVSTGQMRTPPRLLGAAERRIATGSVSTPPNRSGRGGRGAIRRPYARPFLLRRWPLRSPTVPRRGRQEARLPRTTSMTSPSSAARCASIIRAVNMSSSARWLPICSGRKWPSPKSGIVPRLVWETWKRAASQAIRISVANARPMPIPMAWPFTAPITGTSHVRMALKRVVHLEGVRASTAHDLMANVGSF